MKIALSVVLAFLIVGCSSEAPKEEKVIDTKQVEVVEEKSALEKASENVAQVKDDLQEKALEVKESVAAQVEDVKADLEAKVTETKASVAEATTEVMDTVTNKVAEVETQAAATVTNAVAQVETKATDTVNSVVAQVESQTVDASALYAKCAGCHGSNGERAALGKSAIIKDWSSAQVEEALLGYQDGSYGAAMKAIMKPQVSGLSASEIKALSKHISDM